MRLPPGLSSAVVLLGLTAGAVAQVPAPLPSSLSDVPIALQRAANTGSVLMIAAHPDDEHTGLLAYFALGRRLRTGYLSLTRGEGGQNVIGSEKGTLLGAIRTQELLAARQIDGAEQFFTSAMDFGYSKTAEETLRIWDRTKLVGEVVRVLREFQPDVVILRWTGTPADGHGHHQASNIVGLEAIQAAAQADRFPDQQLRPWKTPRVFVFGSGAGSVGVDVGAYDPLLGASYTELAAISRSQHRSQAMGAAQAVGSARVSLLPIGSAVQGDDPFAGLASGPERLSMEYAAIMTKALATLHPERPHQIVPMLLQARRVLQSLNGDLAARKTRELDEVIARCAGIRLVAAAQRASAHVQASVKIQIHAINRSPVRVRLEGVDIDGAPSIQPADLIENKPWTTDISWTVPAVAPRAQFKLLVAGEPISLTRPVVYRYVDRILGERTQTFAVTPPVSVAFPDAAILFRDTSPRDVPVRVRSYSGATEGKVSLLLPPGWTSDPASQPFRFAQDGAETTLRFRVTPPAGSATADIRAVAEAGALRSESSVTVIRYPHIPPVTVVEPAAARLARADVRVLSKTVGYIEGAGDDVPSALRQLGVDVKLLSLDELPTGELGRYDAIVIGVRAFNVREELRASVTRLNEYVKGGGRLIVQYNTADRSLGSMGPLPFALGRGRVSVEEAPVRITQPQSPVLLSPNRITPADFEGWVQERGLYFPSQWDKGFEAPLSTNDPGEKPLESGILFARYGEGVYIYTSFSWFRQLPAGVPGAYRIFANLLSQ